MATKSLTFSKIEGITSGSAFTVNAFASDKTVSAMVYFGTIGENVNLTKLTPKINSVKVGGQNWLSTEIIKITYEIYVNVNGTWQSASNIFPNASDQVSEKDGTVSSSVTMTCNVGSADVSSERAFAYKITVESTQNLVGCKVVMSGFQLSAEYTIRQCVVTINRSPVEGGTVSGAGTYNSGTQVTAKATPNDGYKFVGWANQSGVVTTTSNPYVFTVINNTTFNAVFEKTAINKIYIGTSQPKKIYIGTQEVKAVYVGTTKVYG